MNQRRIVNIEKTCFDKLKKYCDEHGLKISPFISAIITEKFSNLESNNILIIKSEDVNIYLKLNELFYNILNVRNNLKIWVDDIIIKGNSFVHLKIIPDKGIISYNNYKDLTRIENEHVITFTDGNVIFDNYQILHFRTLKNFECFPYGVAVNFKDSYLSDSSTITNDHKINRLKMIIESELMKAVIIHLYALGYRDNQLLDCELTINKDLFSTFIKEQYLNL